MPNPDAIAALRAREPWHHLPSCRYGIIEDWIDGRRLYEEKVFDYPPMIKHPFTCDKCSWGRNPENFSMLEYEKHMDTAHDKEA